MNSADGRDVQDPAPSTIDHRGDQALGEVERGMDVFDARLESRVTDARKAAKALLAELAGAA